MEKQTEENGIRKRGKVEGVRRLKKEARGVGVEVDLLEEETRRVGAGIVLLEVGFH